MVVSVSTCTVYSCCVLFGWVAMHVGSQFSNHAPLKTNPLFWVSDLFILDCISLISTHPQQRSVDNKDTRISADRNNPFDPHQHLSRGFLAPLQPITRGHPFHTGMIFPSHNHGQAAAFLSPRLDP